MFVIALLRDDKNTSFRAQREIRKSFLFSRVMEFLFRNVSEMGILTLTNRKRTFLVRWQYQCRGLFGRWARLPFDEIPGEVLPQTFDT
uniref:Uncharacterized protein n=1 Tax=Candidatus Kentrum sp. MB TaxID=2138164 RepID=A0A450XKK2_9GAMM|nr:MAG: hypothetical protein BECKMB1821G_GA0114241_10539 [Candidatus Kentron sp. MB]VFK33865.1 MAG: hypothetical protein BECKMB1821I_GA0114274_10559 [Candidatus Kentron sp. MB]VFK76471.1 MAG: hypothetical protein BECKMB1821H_GA0114242_10589 [Candidatus Kentron sp. MB]